MRIEKPTLIKFEPNPLCGSSEAHRDYLWKVSVHIPGMSTERVFKTVSEGREWALKQEFKVFSWEEVTDNGRWGCD